jgi:hypothetical protein
VSIERELVEEHDLPDRLQGKLTRIGLDGQFKWDFRPQDREKDKYNINNEFRSLYVYKATEEELVHIKDVWKTINAQRATMTEAEFEQYIEAQQKLKSGYGEVWDYIFVNNFETLKANALETTETYSTGTRILPVEFTSDLLEPLMKGTYETRMGTVHFMNELMSAIENGGQNGMRSAIYKIIEEARKIRFDEDADPRLENEGGAYSGKSYNDAWRDAASAAAERIAKLGPGALDELRAIAASHKDYFSEKCAVDAIKKIEADRDSQKRQFDGGIKAADEVGGIDFRAMPRAIQPAVNPASAISGSSLMSLQELDKQWSVIRKKMAKGEMPYTELKGYVSACASLKDNAKQLETVTACITNILKLEEERALPTAPELKEILAYLS